MVGAPLRVGPLYLLIVGASYGKSDFPNSLSDSRFIAFSYEEDKTGHLFDRTAGKAIDLPGDAPPILRVCFSPDGKLLATTCHDNTIRLWGAATGRAAGTLRGHKSVIGTLAFSPDGRRIASGSLYEESVVRLWDVATCREVVPPLAGHRNEVLHVAFSPDGKRLASVVRDDKVYLWEVAAGRRARELAVPTKANYLQVRAAWGPRGTLVACGGTDGSVRLWGADSGDVEATPRGHEGWVCDVAFRPDGEQLASGGFDRTVRLWEVAARRQVAALAGHGDIVQHVTYSPDGRLLASASLDRTVRLWDTRTHQQLAVLPHGSPVHGAAFSPDGARLATGCHNTVRLWDVATRQQVAELRGHTDYVHAVAFSPDGTRLVSGSGDKTVRIWDALPVQERTRLSGK